VNCAEARDLYSAFVDDVLEAAERARLEAHLAGCGECPRELARFRATVSLLQSIERPRASAGFVDRVLAAARPAPWYRRALRGLFLPLPVKLPVEAAALVMVAVLGVQLFRSTPALREAALEEAARPAQVSAPPSVAGGPTPPGAGQREAPASPPGPEQPRRTEAARASARPEELGRQRADAQREDRALELRDAARIAERATSTAPATDRPGAPAPPAIAAEPRAKAPTPASTAKDIAAVEADVSGALTVADRDAAERALATLAARLGAAPITRRADGGTVVVEVLVPRGRYAEFVRELGRGGRGGAQREPAELPERVRMRLRITG
jgi:hypothetical protein